MVKRIFVEKKKKFAISSKNLISDIKNVLGIKVEDIKIYLRYDIQNIDDTTFRKSLTTIFSEKPDENLYKENIKIDSKYKYFVTEYLPGQYDQRADWAMQCVQLLNMKVKPDIRCATVYAMKGIDNNELDRIKKYLINPVESREGKMEKPSELIHPVKDESIVPTQDGFIKLNDKQLEEFHKDQAFAMSIEDLKHVQNYFIKEKRDPRETELKVIDTYWSDHCRHTTFNTELTNIKIKSKNPHIQIALNDYEDLYKKYNGSREDKYQSLMDIATIGAKHLKSIGLLTNLDISDEINACSIEVDVENNNKNEKWLIMFKNETHNHPTEIEPFGGAATCLGGAIRDPLSGRVYVYQAMRVTGAADPRTKFEDTLEGKLPQRVLTKTATQGYSSYGNQIGLATGIVEELYHDRFVAKRMECGFVIGGAPKANVVRQKPSMGDVIILLGGDTGRDGCGGATGSSKSHDLSSVEKHGAEVQKGNALIERNIQRLFKRPEVSTKIIKCNDFGAGGVSVAIGELADSLDINLDLVPTKYDGLTGTELAISESQERMAVVVKSKDVEAFINYAKEENLNAVNVAQVTDTGYMRMYYRGDLIVNLSREFLDTNGVKQKQDVVIEEDCTDYFTKLNDETNASLENNSLKTAILDEMKKLNVCSQKGMQDYFDGTIGSSSVYVNLGGKYKNTPAIAMAAKVPVSGYTRTTTVSSYACYPDLMEKSPFIGSIYSVLGSLSKQIASGIALDKTYLTFQEYFKKLNKDDVRWGEPTSALLGALKAQIEFGIGSIGGKDSMSGTFEDIDVVPTLISFAVGIGNSDNLITNVFTNSVKENNYIYHVTLPRDQYGMPNFSEIKKIYEKINIDIRSKNIVAANVVSFGGPIAAILKSLMGNRVGAKIKFADKKEMFLPLVGDFIIQGKNNLASYAKLIGEINDNDFVTVNNNKIKFDEIEKANTSTLEEIFPTKTKTVGKANNLFFYADINKKASVSLATPKVLLPIFPGTNCEIDVMKKFTLAGAKAETLILKNQNESDIADSVNAIVKAIKNSQIIALAGGFSAGDEPGGSGKFIATTFRNPKIAKAIMKFLERDGLIIGICNGFQALIKLGLLPHGKIVPQGKDDPTLTYNTIGRHESTMVKVRVATNKSPWLSNVKVGEIYDVPVSHGEGRFIANDKMLEKIIQNGQVLTQYVDYKGSATMEFPFNPNGSMQAIEGIISPDGKILGKMGHSERIQDGIYKNAPGNYDMKIFESGVEYFK